MSKPLRSVITCDLEGRIQTYDAGAEAIFGYSSDEVIGKRRVSMFSPGLVVLGHVGTWLGAACKHGEFKTRTVFLRKNGEPFSADIRITPTYKREYGQKKQIGYCGISEPLPNVAVSEAMPPTSITTRVFSWLVITRAPFLSATLIPVMVSGAWVGWRYPSDPFPWFYFILALVGATSLHVSANTFNDYFDWRSGADKLNVDYFTPYSGGSRSVELGLIGEQGLLCIAIAALFGSLVATAPLVLARGPPLVAFGVTGAFLAYFYTAPPIRLCARHGLGELAVGLAFGPLLSGGCVFALTGRMQIADFVIGLPLGFLTVAILLINEFPDAEADELAGKNHLVVTFGKPVSRWLYVGLLFSGFFATVVMVAAGTLPAGALIMLLALPIAVRAVAVLFRHYLDRALIEANGATIKLHLLAGCLLAAGIVAGGMV